MDLTIFSKGVTSNNLVFIFHVLLPLHIGPCSLLGLGDQLRIIALMPLTFVAKRGRALQLLALHVEVRVNN